MPITELAVVEGSQVRVSFPQSNFACCYEIELESSVLAVSRMVALSQVFSVPASQYSPSEWPVLLGLEELANIYYCRLL